MPNITNITFRPAPYEHVHMLLNYPFINISVEQIDKDTKQCYVQSDIWMNKNKIPVGGSYSNDYSSFEIIADNYYRIMNMAGLKIKEILTCK